MVEWYKDPEWILRMGVAGEFLGHGAFALGVKEGWFKYFAAVGISEGGARTLLPLIGAMDVLVALLVLFFPLRIALGWATLWGFWTALLRPIGGDPVWDFVERWANWAAPFALLLLRGLPKKLEDWFKT